LSVDCLDEGFALSAAAAAKLRAFYFRPATPAQTDAAGMSAENRNILR
jgi:hypothetical protein